VKLPETKRFPGWLRIFAAIAGSGMAILATQAAPAQASVPKKVAWHSTNLSTDKPDGDYLLDNNVVSPQAGPQTIWMFSNGNWGVESTQSSTTRVQAYPCIKKIYTSPRLYATLKYLRSDFNLTMPSAGGLIAAATYAVWLNNHAVEVRMWVNNKNRLPAGHKLHKASIIYGRKFTVWQKGPDSYTFVLAGAQEIKGRAHLLSALRFLVENRKLSRSDTVSEVDFGWEIVSTGGSPQDFGATNYSVSSRRKLPPKVATANSGVAFGVRWTLFGGVVAIFVAMFILAILMLGKISRAGRDRTLTGMFSRYGPRHQAALPQKEPEAESTGRVATAAVSAMGHLMTSGSQERLARRLDLAGITRKPAQWALIGGCIGVVIAATLSLVTSYVLLGVLAGAVIGWLSMRMSLSVRILRRRSAFSDQLPDILQLIASTLQAGFSLPQALDAVVREQAQPAAGEFSRALAEARLGARIEDGLDAVATRMDSDDLHWTVMAIRIQQGVGGNLAEVLTTIATTIRERAAMRRQVRALSAEGRLSGYILVALPLIVATWLFISSATYMRPLYTTTLGEVMLFGATGLIVVGALWMHRLIKVEV